MTVFRTALASAALTGLTLTLAATAPVAAQSASAQSSAATTRELVEDLKSQNWLNVTDRTDKGYRNGNPKAEAQLIEFISYTCSHCADFAKQADGSLDLAAVGPGYISVEVRPVIRNQLDLVVSLLVQCGDPDGFKNRHRAFLYAQEEWLGKAINAPQSQKALWSRGTPVARISAAYAIGLDDIMRDRGYDLPDVDRCLRDEAAAQTLLANDRANRAEFAITGTPTFALDGKTLAAGNWPALSKVLQERFRPEPQESVTGG